jgi:two-component system response regulator RegX3
LKTKPVFAGEVIDILQNAGHHVDHFASGRPYLKALNQQQYDIALFDRKVLDMSGSEVLESLKIKGSWPVIFLTGWGAEEDVVAIMDAGADDYIVKPPIASVLLARINALYRRTNVNAQALTVMECGDVTVDFSKRKFSLKGDAVRLTEKEVDLALCFFNQVGVLLSRTYLTNIV